MPQLIVCGHSDDLLEVDILEHMGESSRTIFSDEMSNDTTLSINEHFEIISKWTNNGLLLGITILDEDIVLEEYYKISYDLEDAHYTPKLVVDSSIPICIKGIFGDKQSKLKNDLRKHFNEDDDINAIIEVLENHKLI